MEHPYLFFVKLFELIGLGHFAHAYPHVIYTWVVMAILIGFGFLAAKVVTLIPIQRPKLFRNSHFRSRGICRRYHRRRRALAFAHHSDNFHLYRHMQPDRTDTRIFSTHGQFEYDPVLCIDGGCFYPCHRHQISWRQLHQTFSGTCLVDDSHYFTDRAHRSRGQGAVPVFPALWQHDGA